MEDRRTDWLQRSPTLVLSRPRRPARGSPHDSNSATTNNTVELVPTPGLFFISNVNNSRSTDESYSPVSTCPLVSRTLITFRILGQSQSRSSRTHSPSSVSPTRREEKPVLASGIAGQWRRRVGQRLVDAFVRACAFEYEELTPGSKVIIYVKTVVDSSTS